MALPAIGRPATQPGMPAAGLSRLSRSLRRLSRLSGIASYTLAWRTHYELVYDPDRTRRAEISMRISTSRPTTSAGHGPRSRP